MAIFELTKQTNPIYRNVVNGFAAVDPDYFVLNPFGPNGELSLNEMNVVIDLREEWNGNIFIITLPEISQLTSLNFRVTVTTYYPAFPTVKAPFAAIGNSNDNYDNNNILYQGGTLSVVPQSIEPVDQNYGWWLISNPNPFIIGPAPHSSGETTTMSAQSELPDLAGSEAFKQFFSNLKK